MMKPKIIIADPPWKYADRRLERKDGKQARFGYGCVNHYGTMSTDAIVDLTWHVQNITAPRCHLYLWATMPLLPDAMRVMTAWGFSFSTVAFCWVKMNSRRWEDAVTTVLQASLFPVDGNSIVTQFLNALTFFGPGFYTGSNIELVLLGTKGRPFAHADGCKASQVVYAPLSAHSAKPDEVQRRIEWMYPEAMPRLEMFARRDRPGWTCIGNEAPGTVGEDIHCSLQSLESMVK